VGAFINQAAEVHGGKGISQDLWAWASTVAAGHKE
jgi:hypothetical protein